MLRGRKRQYGLTVAQTHKVVENGNKSMHDSTVGNNFEVNKTANVTKEMITHINEKRVQRQSESELNRHRKAEATSNRGYRQTRMETGLGHSGPQTQIQESLDQSTSQTQTQTQENLNHQFQSEEVPNDVDNSISSQVKKGRGGARFPKQWNSGKKLKVFLDHNGIVVGPDYNKYVTAIGCLARIGVKLPLNTRSFTSIPQYQRDMIWDEVQDNTELPPEAKMVVMYSVGEMWRKWKSYVKKTFFLPHKDDEEFLLEQPADDKVQLDQWLELINTWKDPKVQDIAEQNSINVLKKKCLYRTGRTPFFILKEEMVGKGATQVANLDVWMESRSRGKGIQEDETTSDVYAQFTRALSKKPECERTREFKDELFLIAMGKEGRNHVRCAPRGSFINRYGTKFGLRDEGSFQDREELLKLKDELIQKQDEV